MTDWSFACPDWEDRLRAGKSLVPRLPLNEKEAGRAVAMFDKLRLPDVPGQPPMATAAGEWQRDIVRAIFGSLIDGHRMVPEVFCMVPKKNSKTTGGAAISLTAMLMNERPRAEFIFIGPTQEVADLAFQQAVGMIEADDYLAKRFHIAHHTKTITDRRNKSRLKVKTFDMKVVTGSKPSFILLDELHLMSTINGADRVIGQIRGGMLPNPEAVLVIITTQSDRPPAGAFRSELEYARDVRDGRIKNGRMLPILYEFPVAIQTHADKPWKDPANWPMVLPNLDRSITLDRLIADYSGACAKGDEEERRWASQHLNIEIGLAIYANRWPGADYWSRSIDQRISTLRHFDALRALLELCECVTIGGDGGGLDDLWGFNVLGRLPEWIEVEVEIAGVKTMQRFQPWLSWSHAWCHEGVLERRKKIAPVLRDFEKAGELTIVGDELEDLGAIVELVRMVKDAGVLGGVGVDPAGLGEFVDALRDPAIDVTQENDLLIGVPQGFAMMNAIKTTERRLARGLLRHCGGLLMPWSVANLKIEPTATAIRATKQTAGDAKIDPVMALFDSVFVMLRNPEPQGGRSVFDTMSDDEPAPAARQPMQDDLVDEGIW